MAYRMGLQPTAHPNSGITQSSGYSLGQRIKPVHLKQKPNPFGIVYNPEYGAVDLGGSYGNCGCNGNVKSTSSHHLLDKQTLVLLLLAFGLGYLMTRRK
jgi:hypothetical protein